ncbi:Uu.00g058270.m01.CDS01 [Anthostomella pinea]|uniref:Uu.00g058270.m01.CDS01 n=1 Tax=Anthostomella pinea TaxID=933095 RepID=A0AAI8VT08_9PEZI|nr:Uu.00g058270.m01.CDS01 [Anthostomella pinea]
MSDSPVLREFYRISAVQLGLRCDYIMRTLLAVSGLHLAHYRPHMRDYYQSVAITHHQTASRAAMELMSESDISRSTAQDLFLFSSLTTIFALASPRKEDGFLLIGESGFPDWMSLLQGSHTFIQIAGVETDGLLSPVLTHGRERWHARQNSNKDHDSPAQKNLDSMQTLIASHQSDESLLQTYAKAIEELQKSFSLSDGGRGRDLTDAFVWIFVVADDLLPLLRVPTQEAVAIFSFFCVLLKRLETKSYHLLDEEHRLWIQWPIEEMGWVS